MHSPNFPIFKKFKGVPYLGASEKIQIDTSDFRDLAIMKVGVKLYKSKKIPDQKSSICASYINNKTKLAKILGCFLVEIV